MSLKIIVKPEKVAKREITLEDIKPGTVFEYDSRVVGLKLKNGEVALLKYSNGNDWFDLAIGYKTESIKRILGYLNEIIVVKE